MKKHTGFCSKLGEVAIDGFGLGILNPPKKKSRIQLGILLVGIGLVQFVEADEGIDEAAAARIDFTNKHDVGTVRQNVCG